MRETHRHRLTGKMSRNPAAYTGPGAAPAARKIFSRNSPFFLADCTFLCYNDGYDG